MPRELGKRLEAVRAHAWKALQGTVAATIAWAVAKQLPGQHDPFFAPISAFIALNAPFGERGRNAVRLLVGVFAGIAVGELTVAAFSGYGGLAVATFVAASLAAALGGSRIMIAQSATSAILVVAVATEPGLYRALDALIGAGVALVFSQAIFSPEPLALLRRAESEALSGLAEGMALTTRALEHDDEEEAQEAIDRLRKLRDELAELSRVRGASSRVARRSAVWRSQRTPVVRESESAAHLDLLVGSCLSFARAALGGSPETRAGMAPSAGELATALSELARDPGDRAVRQSAADYALELVRRLARAEGALGSSLLAAVATGRMVVADLMAFAGVDPEEAVAAVRGEMEEIHVATPPQTPTHPLRPAERNPIERLRRSLKTLGRRLRSQS